jgi:GT2 family glycosyltransferase/glycosyltransferase involved in cell wall biosynthesis
MTGSSTFIFIDFKWAQTARPCDINISSDARELSAGVRLLQIKSASGQLLAGIDFRLGGNSLSHVCYGFSYIEDWGTWTQGAQSSVLLWLPSDAPDKLVLHVDAGCFSDAFDNTTASVLVNGHDIGQMSFGDHVQTTLHFDLSAIRAGQPKGNGQNLSLVSDKTPEVSIIILNFNKPGITLAAVLAILQAKTDLTYEIIVLDNGSSNEAAQTLSNLKLPVRLIRLFANRYFGEGNNIAAEQALADKLLFLNNDAFIEDHTLDLLKNALDSSPKIGAVGPVFRYPDGALQEAGAFLNKDGTAYQRGKGVKDFDVSVLPELDVVDYVSAACVMVRRADFAALGGFDLRYDPAYYEDSDLCLRLLALKKKTVLVRDAAVRHIENATTSDPRNKGLATDIVERHRQIFLSRWQPWLLARTGVSMPKVKPLDVQAIQATIAEGRNAALINVVYSPFPMVQGGGERYLLGAALALRSEAPTAFVTPDEYSASRLNTLMRELGYPTAQLFPEVERKLLSRNVGVFVLMGNELFPTREGYGSNRIYHCQFPFPTSVEDAAVEAGKQNLTAYRCVVVNSEFTRTAYLRQLSEHSVLGVDVRVIYPPVQILKLPPVLPLKENIILSIGRFSPHGHSKRQDIIVEAMKALIQEGEMTGWRLLLCGVVPNESDAIKYYEQILEKAKGFPIDIILSPSRQKLDELLLRAKVYVSATGVGVRAPKDYWRCEHFGITVVEAASAGCIPVAYTLGGPAEIIARLGVGSVFTNGRSLVNAIKAAAIASGDLAKRQAAIAGVQAYAEEPFLDAWRALV